MSSTGQIVGGVVGGVIGAFAGYPMLGAQLGMLAGGYLDPPKGPTQNGPRLNDLSVQTSTYGAVIPRVYGTVTVNGNIFWLENNALKETVTKKKSGGKGGGSKTTTRTYTYSATFAVGLCKGPIVGVRRIWVGPDLFYDAGSNDANTIAASNIAANGFAIYTGNNTQLADARMQATLGSGNTPAWRGLAYIVFYDLALAKYGNSLMGAQVRVEVVTLGATQNYPVVAATAPNYYWQEPAWDGSVYCAISYFYNALAICSDGVSWVESTLPSSRTYTTGWQGVASDGKGTLLVYGVNEIWRSTDHGVTWTNCPNGYAGYTTQIVWNGSYWLCITDNGNFYTSPTGQTWTAQTPPAGTGSYARSLVWNASFGLWSVIPDFGGSVRIYTSPSGNTGSWTLRKTFSGDENSFACGTAMNGTLVYMGIGTVSGVYNDHAYVSTDGGGTWTGYATILGRESITNNGKVFLVTNNSGYFTSSDGVNWSAITLWPTNGQAAWVACTPPTGPLGFAVVGPGVYAAFIYEHFITSTSPTLDTIVSAECLQSGLLTAGDIDVTALASQQVRGYRIGSIGAIRAALEPLQASWPFDVVQHGYKIRYIVRGGSSVVTIPAADLDARAAGQEPGVQITTSREMDSQLPRRVTMQHLDYDREYNTGTQYAERLNTAAINETVLDLPIVLTGTEAAGKAEVLLYLYWMERHDVAFTLPMAYNYLEPSDVVTLVTPEGNIAVRLTTINYTSDGRLECKAKYANPAIYTPTAVGASPLVTGPATIPSSGPSDFVLLDVPHMNTAQDTPSFLAAMYGGSGWPGGVLIRTDDDGMTWSDIQAFAAPGGVVGTATNTIGSVDSRVWDKASALNVTMYNGTLSSTTELAVLNGANYFAYGTDGRWEIIAAQTCALLSGTSYVLSDFLRGRFGTEWAMSTHVVGDKVVALNTNDVTAIGMSSASIGLSRAYRGITEGQDISTDTDTMFTYKGVNLECLSPAYFHGDLLPLSTDWGITWIRRSRTDGEWRDLVDVGLSETSEAYEVDIYSDNTYTTVKRTIAVTSPSCTYTTTQQTADFGAAQNTIYAKLYQLSSVVGRGYPTTATLIAGTNDQYFAYVVFLAPMTGSNNGTTFTEVKGHALTANGNAKTSTAQYVGSIGSSGLFDGTGDYVTTAQSTDFNFSTNPATIEAWVYINANSAADGAGMRRAAIFSTILSSDTSYWNFIIDGDGSTTGTGLILEAKVSGTTYNRSIAVTISQSTWHHISVSIDSSGTYFSVDGAVTSASAIGQSITGGSYPSIGYENLATWTRDFNGYIGPVRITKGVARYKSNFTPIVGPFPTY